MIVNAVADAYRDEAGPSPLHPVLRVMIVLLVVGFVANELIRPVDARRHEPEPQRADVRRGIEGAQA